MQADSVSKTGSAFLAVLPHLETAPTRAVLAATHHYAGFASIWRGRKNFAAGIDGPGLRFPAETDPVPPATSSTEPVDNFVEYGLETGRNPRNPGAVINLTRFLPAPKR